MAGRSTFQASMQVQHHQNIQPSAEALAKVHAVAWSPNCRRLAVADANLLVSLFDDSGTRRDKFATKPRAKDAPKNYTIPGMTFSPDSTMLAIAQSDCIVYVYRLGLEWGDRKKICNKFVQTSPVSSITWPSQRPGEVVFGCVDGNVKLGIIKNNKTALLYSTDSQVVSMCSSPDGRSFLSGHLDGSVHLFSFDDPRFGGEPFHEKILTHSCIPYALGWGDEILVAGSDCKIQFYDVDGNERKRYDFSRDDTQKEFTKVAFNPSGKTAVVGSFDRLRVFTRNSERHTWEDNGSIDIPHYYTITDLDWKPDGSKLASAALCGAVDLWDTCIGRRIYKGKFEMNTVSEDQVIVRKLSTGDRIVVESNFKLKINKVDVFEDRYIVARTTDTLLLGNFDTLAISEVQWIGSGTETFHFDNPAVCMIFNAGELTLVEYGKNDILGRCRTDYMSPHLISVRLEESMSGGSSSSQRSPMKSVAFLIDKTTVRITDLVTSFAAATVHHEATVDWLGLSPRGNKLLFRDKNSKLLIFDINTQQKTSLLGFCNYCQWVPGSDVVVAQSRGEVCVWYNIEKPDNMTSYPVKGDVVEIVRAGGETRIVVDDGLSQEPKIVLSEAMIEFGSALEYEEYDRAASILESLEQTAEVETMWRNLATAALKNTKLLTAERCYAALGDVCKARYLHGVNKQVQIAAQELGGDGTDYFDVRAKLLCLEKDFEGAAEIYVEQGHVEEAMAMYEELHRFDLSLKYAERYGHPEAVTLRENFFHWLVETHQEEKAAELKEDEGKFVQAINLYLSGGMPGKAAAVVSNQPQLASNQQLMEAIASALFKAHMFEKAGDFFEKLGSNDRALDAYRGGHAFGRAVELARKKFPSEVVNLEEEWGDWLFSQKQYDSAINHFIEAGSYVKAIETAMLARQWNKVVQYVDILDLDVALPYYIKLARHFEESRLFAEAEKYYISGEDFREAVNMYSRAGMFNDVYRVAERYLSKAESTELFLEMATKFEREGKLRDAEKLYLKINEEDLAIGMYKNHKQYDQMLGLVRRFRSSLLADTLKFLASQLEAEGNFKQAEQYLLENNDWKSAISMYRKRDMWEDALRVARLNGGQDSVKQVAYLWAKSLGGEAGTKVLVGMGLVEVSIDYACEVCDFDLAMSLAQRHAKPKIKHVHRQQALFFEDKGDWVEAESEFLKAGVPAEAVEMYIFEAMWDDAKRVAEHHDTTLMPKIYEAEAKQYAQQGNFEEAEALFLRVQKPEEAVNMHKDAGRWDDARRVARDYAPHLTKEVNLAYAKFMSGSGGAGNNVAESAAIWAESGEYNKAIDLYLKATPQNTRNAHELKQCWTLAFKLASTHARDRAVQVARTVGQRLLEAGSVDEALDVFEKTELYREAAEAAMALGKWDRAKTLARRGGRDLQDYVEKEHMERLMAEGDSSRIVEVNVEAGLQLLAKQGKWDECLRVAQSEGGNVLRKYATMKAEAEHANGKLEDSISTLVSYGPSQERQFIEFYVQLSQDAVRIGVSLADVREILFEGGRELPKRDKIYPEYEKMLRICHCYYLAQLCSQRGMVSQSAQLYTSLLRYAGTIPVDKAFYDAGTACRDAGDDNMAFVFLSRYTDLVDQIDAPEDAAPLDNIDFIKTDIPYDFPIPKKHSVEREDREDVRNWVLSIALELPNLQQELPMRVCDTCGADVFTGSLLCTSCKTELPPCAVTGFPVLPSASVKCTECGCVANREDWNLFVETVGQCPWCSTVQNPRY